MPGLFQTRVYVNRQEKPDLTSYSIIALLIGLILYVIAPDKWYAVPFFVVSAAMTYIQRFYYDSGKQKLYGYLGRYLIFKKEGIVIEGKLYPYNEIDKLRIDVGDFDGEEYISAYASSIKRGINNFIEFNYQNKHYKFAFHIQSKQHQDNLRMTLDALIIRGIKVEAYYKGRPSNIF